MKRRIISTIFSILVLSCYSEAQNNNTFVFTHVNVIPMNKEVVLPDYSVIVSEGKIKEMGSSSSVKIPKGATVINAKGKYLIPSLSDMHVHVEGDAWNIMFKGSEFTADEINFDDILFLYIANGITTVDILSALPEHIVLREKIKNNEMLGPRLILSRMIDGAGKAWPPPISTWINNADEAEKAIKEIHAQGYDRIKVYSFLDVPSYDRIIATAKILNMPVDGHVPFASSVEHVVSSGQKMIAHNEEIMKFVKDNSPEQIDYFADLLAKNNTWVTTSLILNKNLNALLKDPQGQLSRPGSEYLHPMATGIWKFIYENIYKPIPEKHRVYLQNGYDSFQKPFTYQFHSKGGKLLSGTDALVPSTLPGFALHDELEELVITGLTPFEALKISTTNAYEFLGELDNGGTIEVGKAANLLLLDDNPLKDISNSRMILGVMTQGRWVSKEEIEKRMKKIKDSNTILRNKKKF